jgi:GNAT superfamily N-acetyltransferase
MTVRLERGVAVACEAIEARVPSGEIIGTVTFANGELIVYVKPSERRKGIATALMREAVKCWNIDFDAQKYTEDGEKFFAKFLGRSR